MLLLERSVTLHYLVTARVLSDPLIVPPILSARRPSRTLTMADAAWLRS